MADCACNLLFAGGCKKFLEATTALAMCGMTFIYNGIFSTNYLQWFTCGANFHSIEIMVAP